MFRSVNDVTAALLRSAFDGDISTALPSVMPMTRNAGRGAVRTQDCTGRDANTCVSRVSVARCVGSCSLAPSVGRGFA
jgi:hypothetical protein